MVTKKNSKGFAALEGLLILVILAILGGTGWYVYDAHKKANDSLASANAVNSYVVPKSSKKVAKDPTADWITYSSKDGHFSLKYPKTWVAASDPTLCSSGSLLLGVDSKSVGHCGADGPSAFGQISVYTMSVSDTENGTAITKNGYKDYASNTVTADGIKGQMQTGIASGQSTMPDKFAFPLPDGAKVIRYTFSANGRYYISNYYSQTASGAYPDATSDFNLMVTKTLKFSS